MLRKQVYFPGMKRMGILLVLALLSACQSGPMIPGFDSEKWINDTKGCQGLRKEMAVGIINQKDKIKKYKYEQLLVFLGRPDLVDRYNRGKKNIVYFIEPGKQCEENSSYKAEKLVLEIGPLGEVMLVRTEKSF
ncbi:MAG: hypothetical protein MUF42_14510 [Cytophagaceae bacterium]|jgi:hypothetical protein|nr:hypothetical protein [Cytophagaceae bacterium]